MPSACRVRSSGARRRRAVERQAGDAFGELGAARVGCERGGEWRAVCAVIGTRRLPRGRVVVRCEQQHAPDNFSRRDALGAWDGSVLAERLGGLVHVAPIDDAWIIAVDDVVYLISADHPAHVLVAHHVWHVGHDLIDKLRTVAATAPIQGV